MFCSFGGVGYENVAVSVTFIKNKWTNRDPDLNPRRNEEEDESATEAKVQRQSQAQVFSPNKGERFILRSKIRRRNGGQRAYHDIRCKNII